ncbi:MAG: tRNA lysidine(34) synthetase TilS [Planctomycetota bacterium]|nr:MAG: tRNA lysidine(34) synthetase TilS [Planctomycetota bacterium]
MSNLTFLKKFESSFLNHIPPHTRILIAFSGGPDSTALVYGVKKLIDQGKWQGKVALGHFFHPYQRDATPDKEQLKLVEEHSKILQWPLFIGKKDVLSIHQEKKGSLEEIGRKERYLYLAKVLEKWKANLLLTGHHFEDQVETVLQRLFRGSGIHGAGGIRMISPLPFSNEDCHQKSFQVFRPMLEIHRHEILEFLEKERLPFFQDYANTNLAFFRNQVRHKILPFLSQFGDHQLGSHLFHLSQQAQWWEDFLQKELAKYSSLLWQDSFGTWWLDNQVLQLPRALGSEMVRKACRKLGILPSFLHVKSILDGEKKGSLPQNYSWSQEKQGIGFFLNQSPPSLNMELPLPGEAAIHQDILVKSQLLLPSFFQKKLEAFPQTFYLDRQSLAEPIVIRYRKKGDLFHPLGSKGKNKLKKIFINKKIPFWIRDRLLIGEDSSGRIVFVEGVGIHHHCRIQESTKEVIKIEIHRKKK